MKYFASIIFLVTFFSCSQTETVVGIVQDFKTNQPISKAYIYEKNNPDNNTYSDTVGKFTIKALTVIIEKNNYQDKTVSFDHCESEYILLKAIGQ